MSSGKLKDKVYFTKDTPEIEIVNMALWLIWCSPFLSTSCMFYQRAIPCGTGHVMAPWGIQLCSLPLLLGRRFCGREGRAVLCKMLRGHVRSHLFPLPTEDSWGVWEKYILAGFKIYRLFKNVKCWWSLCLFRCRKLWMLWNKPGIWIVLSAPLANSQ